MYQLEARANVKHVVLFVTRVWLRGPSTKEEGTREKFIVGNFPWIPFRWFVMAPYVMETEAGFALAHSECLQFPDKCDNQEAISIPSSFVRETL